MILRICLRIKTYIAIIVKIVISVENVVISNTIGIIKILCNFCIDILFDCLS